MKFKIGDVVITKRCSRHTGGPGPRGPAGVECTIRAVDSSDPRGLFYETDIPYDGEGCGIYPYWWGCDDCFERKPPPQRQEVGKWESCVWQPSPETVRAEHD